MSRYAAHPSGHDFGRVVGIGQHPGYDQRNCAVCRRKIQDVQLQAAIEEAMRTSPLTANSLIVVHVNQGEVTLEGTAKNSLAQREATRLAETVLGVKGIRNRLGFVNTQTAVVPQEK